ncbi:MAG: alpha-amylase [Spirochaetia bacterium]
MSEHNGAMMQFFHWYTAGDGTLWRNVSEQAEALVAAGITALWLPPAYKGADGGSDVGYAVYDLFDLGEFDQKGSVRTKYGTRDEYLTAIKDAQAAGLQVYADIVFSHKLGGDKQEEFEATPYDPENREKAIGKQQRIKAWTHFNFPGRARTYSELHWHWWHFNAADYNALDDKTEAIYLFKGKTFGGNVDLEKGNFDFLMGCNLDINDSDVRTELFYWGEWLVDTTGVDGFRFDAVKHVSSGFFVDWLKHVREYTGRNLFAVGEYWSGNVEALQNFLDATDGNLMLFDVALHFNFAKASKLGAEYDIRLIFEKTLVQQNPQLAVTLVSNHDSQPLQSLESVVEAWFKPLAYALILLRRDGYPCIFAADYYGAHYTDIGSDGKPHEIWMERHQWMIDTFLSVRQTFAFGEQYDYFDDPGCIGWTRLGTDEHPGGLAVVLSTSSAASAKSAVSAASNVSRGGASGAAAKGNPENWTKQMQTGAAGTRYIDVTEHIRNPVTTDAAGWATFPCLAGSVSVWVPG